jgi:hypothetical protein
MLIAAVLAPVFDTMCGGTPLGPIPVDRRIATMLYPRLWWVGPLVLGLGGLAVAVVDDRWDGRLVGALAVVLSLLALTLARPPVEPVPVPGWVGRLRRSSAVTDTRRWRRLCLLLVGSAALLTTAVLRPVIAGQSAA